MGSGVTSGHPSQEFSVVDDEIGKGELMRVEQERCDDQRHYSDPEVNHVPSPDGQCCKKQNDHGPDTQIYGRPGESRVENAEGDSSCSETSTCSDISSATKVQVAKNRMSVDLGREHFEDRRSR